MVAINDRRERKEILPDVAKRMSLNRFFEAQRDVVNDELEALVPDLIEDALENPTGSYQRTNNKIMYRLDTINKNTKLIKKDTDEILTFLKKDLQDKLDELSDGQGGGLLGSIMSMFGFGAAAGTGKSLFSRLRGGPKTPEIPKTPTATPDKTGRFRVKDLPPEEQQKFLEKGRKPSDFIKNTEAEAAGLTTKAETAVAKSESTLSKLGSKISGFFKSAVGEISAGTSRLLKIGGKLLKPLAIAAVIYKAWDDISKLKRPPEVDATVYRQNIEKVLLMLIAELGFTIVGAAIGTLVVGGATGGVAALAGTIIGLGAGIALDVYLGDDAADLINNKTFISMVDSVVSYFISSDDKKDGDKNKKDALNKTGQIIKNAATSDPYKDLSDEELAAKGLKRAGVVNGTRYSAAQNLYEITGPAADAGAKATTQPPETPDAPKPPDAKNALDAQELTLAETLQVLHASPKLTDENTVMALARKMFPGRKYSLLEKAIAEFLKLHPDGISQATPFTEGVESSLAAAAGSGSYLAAKQMAADTAAGILPSTAAAPGAPGAATSTAAASTMPYAAPQPGMAAAGPPAGGVPGVTRSEGGGGKAPTYYQGEPAEASSAPTTTFTAGAGEARKNAEAYLGRAMSDEEYDYLVRATHAEAAGGKKADQKEQALIMASILNRARDKGENGVITALKEKNQFQSVTGTSKNNHAPSQNFTQGPGSDRLASIEGSTGMLSAIPHEQKNFTAASSAAYGPGTNKKYRDDMLAAGGTVIGGSVFNTNPDFSSVSALTPDGTSTKPGAEQTASLEPGDSGHDHEEATAVPDMEGIGNVRQLQKGKIRGQEVNPKTEAQLRYISQMTGLQFDVESGEQMDLAEAEAKGAKKVPTGRGTYQWVMPDGKVVRTGSTRHDEHVGAADVKFKDPATGKYLNLETKEGRAKAAEIVKYATAAGMTGFGYGEGYMGQETMHLGGGEEGSWNKASKGSSKVDWIEAARAEGKKLQPVDALAWAKEQQEKMKTAQGQPPQAMPVPVANRDRMAPPPVAEIPVADQVGEKVSSLLEDYRSPPPASLVTPTPGPQQGPSQSFLAMTSAQQRIGSQIYGLPIGNYSKDPSKATIDATYASLAGETGVLS